MQWWILLSFFEETNVQRTTTDLYEPIQEIYNSIWKLQIRTACDMES